MMCGAQWTVLLCELDNSTHHVKAMAAECSEGSLRLLEAKSAIAKRWKRRISQRHSYCPLIQPSLCETKRGCCCCCFSFASSSTSSSSSRPPRHPPPHRTLQLRPRCRSSPWRHFSAVRSLLPLAVVSTAAVLHVTSTAVPAPSCCAASTPRPAALPSHSSSASLALHAAHLPRPGRAGCSAGRPAAGAVPRLSLRRSQPVRPDCGPARRADCGLLGR